MKTLRVLALAIGIAIVGASSVAVARCALWATYAPLELESVTIDGVVQASPEPIGADVELSVADGRGQWMLWLEASERRWMGLTPHTRSEE